MRILLIAALFLALVSCGSSPEDNVLRLQGKTMGTFWHVTLLDVEKNLDKNKIQKQIKEELVKINQQFSTYLVDSEVSQFNAVHDTQPFAVSDAVVDVVNAAQLLSRQTQGAFDITVGPLVDLWGFGSAIKFEAPSEVSIQQAKANTGFEFLTTQTQPARLVKKNPSLRIDLSAIAKGYAVDQVAMLIEQQQINNYLVEIGGELKAKGHNPKAEIWRVAIEKPEGNGLNNPSKVAQHILEIDDKAVATSGDYRNYFEENGVRYSHMIDPKTGKPITHNLASVTVLHQSAMVADGLATAIMVIGEEKGLSFANQYNLQIVMLVRHGDSFRSVSTLKPSVLRKNLKPQKTEE